MMDDTTTATDVATESLNEEITEGEGLVEQTKEQAERAWSLFKQWTGYITEVVENAPTLAVEEFEKIKEEWHTRVAPGLPHFALPDAVQKVAPHLPATGGYIPIVKPAGEMDPPAEDPTPPPHLVEAGEARPIGSEQEITPPPVVEETEGGSGS